MLHECSQDLGFDPHNYTPLLLPTNLAMLFRLHLHSHSVTPLIFRKKTTKKRKKHTPELMTVSTLAFAPSCSAEKSHATHHPAPGRRLLYAETASFADKNYFHPASSQTETKTLPPLPAESISNFPREWTPAPRPVLRGQVLISGSRGVQAYEGLSKPIPDRRLGAILVQMNEGVVVSRRLRRRIWIVNMNCFLFPSTCCP